jgi:hypothetical protein
MHGFTAIISAALLAALTGCIPSMPTSWVPDLRFLEDQAVVLDVKIEQKYAHTCRVYLKGLQPIKGQEDQYKKYMYELFVHQYTALPGDWVYASHEATDWLFEKISRGVEGVIRQELRARTLLEVTELAGKEGLLINPKDKKNYLLVEVLKDNFLEVSTGGKLEFDCSSQLG